MRLYIIQSGSRRGRYERCLIKYTCLAYLVITSAFVVSELEGLTPAAIAELQVNTETTYDQKNAGIAMDAQGNFTVVWSSYLQDGSSNGVFGQRFDPDCKPIGDEFQINTTTAGNQTEPSVAMDAVGNFVVAWHGPGASEEDIFAQRLDPNGQSVGVEFPVNSYTDGRQRYPKVAMNPAGAFAVVWESETVLAEQSVPAICCQLYDANGTAVAEELQVSLEPDSRYPHVAMDGSGNFAVVWLQDTSSNAIIARLYHADGTARTGPFEVSTIRFSSVTRPSIAMNGTGCFVVAWDGDPDLASLDDVHARLYEPNGTAMGEQFTVNTGRAGAQQYPAVAINNSREFVIVWNSRVDPNVNERDIFARQYDSSGNAVGGEFQVNTYAAGDQRHPAVAIKETSESITVWQSDEQDGSGYGIFGQTVPALGTADFTGDGFVDLRDFCVLAEEWQKQEDQLTADLINDNNIDDWDLAAFCQQWLAAYR